MSERVLGIDTSSWSGLFDYNKAKAKGIKFVIMKGSDVGSDTNAGFVDNQLMNSYKNASSAGLITGAYHWMDARIGGKHQAQYYLDNVYKKLELDFMPIVDWEEMEGINQQQKYIDETRYCLDEIEKSTGRIPMIYTARWFTNYFYSSAMAWMGRYPLWVAHYSNVGSPMLPTAWKDYKIWQFSSNASFPYYMTNGGDGFDWGGGKQSGLDMNWFNGSYQDLLDFCSIKPTPPVEEPPIVVTPPAPLVSLFKAQVLAPAGLNVRNAPSATGKFIRLLAYRETVDVYAESNGWYKISPTAEEWSSSGSGQQVYLQKIADVIVPELKPLGKVKITSNVYVNVRSGAGLEYEIIGKLDENAIVDYYVATSLWLKVSATESRWVSKSLTVPYSVEAEGLVGQLDYLYYPYNEILGFPITQYFGSNLSWYASSHGHNGGDFGIPPWNEIFAARSGTIIRADFNNNGYGRSVWIKHFDENNHPAGTTIYGHFKEFRVKVGDIVKARQLIGLSNGELSDPYRGFSTGAHLHFEYRWDKLAPQVNGGFKYNAVNPFPLLRSWDLVEGVPLLPLYKASVTSQGLIIRTGAGSSFERVGWDYYNYRDAITVYQENGDWVRTSPTSNRWVSKNFILKQ